MSLHSSRPENSAGRHFDTRRAQAAEQQQPGSFLSGMADGLKKPKRTYSEHS